MQITIVIPAYNEEAYLGATLGSIEASVASLLSQRNVKVETIVIDNNSSDATAEVAQSKGARVIHEPVQGIARARNTGASHAAGDVLIFIDADVTVPRTLLEVIHGAMRDPNCVGGGVEVDYQPSRSSIRLYLRAWRLLSSLTGMVQGAAQFCRKDVFEQVGGYDETAWIGEDVDFYWAMKRVARGGGLTGVGIFVPF